MGTAFQKISRASREIPIEIGRFVYQKYPSFVTQGKVDTLVNEVPVFMFHTIDSDIFKAQLEYLVANGYKTLNLEAFMAFLTGHYQPDSPSVLLTFDDGEKSWYEVAYPLLKDFSLNAVGFVVPHHIQEQPLQKSQEKIWLSWPELIEMDQSGVIEIESHSYYHARIFSDSHLVDFYNPQTADALGLDVPWIMGEDFYTNKLELGTPLYKNAPRLTAKRRYKDSQQVREACVAWVKAQGGKDFFDQANWKKELTRFYTSIQSAALGEEFESDEQVREEMFKDLVQAKETLSERLNKPVQHLCYPWGAGSDTAVCLSQKAGYISNFWVELDQRNTNRAGDSPFYIPRLKDDYLFRLPGAGRYSLWQIFQAKLKRRSKTLEIY